MEELLAKNWENGKTSWWDCTYSMKYCTIVLEDYMDRNQQKEPFGKMSKGGKFASGGDGTRRGTGTSGGRIVMRRMRSAEDLVYE